MKKIVFGIGMLVVIFFAIFLAINFGSKKQTQTGKVAVVTTLFPLYDFAKNVGGDKVEVTLLLPPGVEAHTFEPKPSDIVKVNGADFFVFTGKFMEPWAQDIIDGLSNKDIKIVDSSAGIELPKENGVTDPHIWLDFDNAKIIVNNVTKNLVEKDPVNADYYVNNAESYKEKLSKLDADYSSAFSKCNNKKIIYGGHYAFAYMGKRYGLQYEAAYGVSPDSEPSAKDLMELVEQIKKGNIKYVFYEELVSPKVAETLAHETGTALLLLNPGHNLTKSEFESNMTFIEIMESNLKNLELNC